MRRQSADGSGLGWVDALVIIAIIALLSAAVALQLAHAAEPGSESLAQVLERASQRFERDNFEGARQEYRRATQLDPGSIPAWRGYGWSLWRLDRQQEALDVWNDILKVQPGDTDTLIALAQACAARQEFTQAKAFYARALRQDPDKVAARIGRARIDLQFARYAAAEADLRRALARKPQDFEAQFMLAQVCEATSRGSEATRIFGRLARTHPGPRYLRQLADVFLELDRPAEALPLYRQNLERNPDNRGTLLGLARAHARLHEYAAATEALEHYVAQHPDDAKVHEDLARIASGGGDYPRAIRHLRVLVQAHPAETKWRMSLARALRANGDPGEGSALAARVLAEQPGDIGAIEYLQGVAVLQGRRQDAVQGLEQLAALDPGAKRYNRLGTAWLQLGEEFAAHDEDGRASEAYRKAAAAYRHAIALEPMSADSQQGLLTSLRLAGDYAPAQRQAQQLTRDYPAIEWAWRERYELRLAQDDYAGAEALMHEWLKRNPGSIRVRQEIARARFRNGERDAAIADMKHLLKEPIRAGVPVLLYHGLSEAVAADDSMPLQNFRDQMLALKKAGYRPITVQQLIAFHRDGQKLPGKPVLITFDDARADSFRYADPVLKETGLRATMFTPVAEVGMHGDYNAVWRTVREMRASGRWDIQCHSYVGHALMPVDASGRGGIFLANRQWLAASKRLETRNEFRARLAHDYEHCASELQRELPGTQVAGYAYPFGEMGQKSLSNEPTAVQVNAALVRRYFQVGFVQDPAAEVTRLSPAATLPRFEVPWNFTGKDLLAHLRRIDAYASTQLALAELYSWDEQYEQAHALFDQVARAGLADDADLLVQRGRVQLWQGDIAGARHYLFAAAELEPGNAETVAGVTQLEHHTRPRLTLDGASVADNQQRESLRGGPVQEVHLADRISLSGRYGYRRLAENAFDPARVDPAWTGGPVALRVTGSEMAAELAWREDWRTMVSLSGGVAKFEDDSSTAVFAQDSASFPLAALSAAAPLGDVADISGGISREYVPTAGAVLRGLAATRGDAQFELRPLRDTVLSAALTDARYEGGNVRTSGSARALQRVRAVPEVMAGYRFRYEDTRRADPLFWSPDRFIGHDLMGTLGAGPFHNTRFEVEASIGTGHERGGSSRLQASVLGTARYELANRLSVYLSGGRDQAAQYRSAQLAGGFALTF